MQQPSRLVKKTQKKSPARKSGLFFCVFSATAFNNQPMDIVYYSDIEFRLKKK